MQRLRALAMSVVLGLGLLSGCATQKPAGPSSETPVTAAPTQGPWQGRFSVKVWSKPVQAFSAGFELQGTPEQGRLELSSVLGTVLARLHWSLEGAVLEDATQSPPAPRQFDSVQAMARQALGVDLPVALFFGWVQGKPLQDADWTADLSQWPDGRISAKRSAEPQAEMVILLER